MKKILLVLSAFALIGAGCLGMGGGKVVEGDWVLAFDLPEGWVMARDYDAGSSTAHINTEINAELTDIVLQSTDKIILPQQRVADYSKELTEDDFATGDYTYIRVFRLDERRVIPSEAEDLGDGFSVEQLADGEKVYYLQIDDRKYQFIIEQVGQEAKVAEEVILSAREVTSFVE